MTYRKEEGGVVGNEYGSYIENENGVYLYKSETLVYEDDAWGIITDSHPDGSTYATHRCLDVASDIGYIGYGEYCWIDKDSDDKKCSYCQEDVPDSIVTLIRIHNWDR